MKILRSWLSEYVDLGDRSNQEIAETLENLGHEVEGIVSIGLPDSVVVGHVLEVAAHPDADRLRVAVVDTGDTKRTIVCGAPNLEIGQKVVVALTGTTLPGGITIEKRAIRGVLSDGMICAADEIGLSGDHSGILVLDDSLLPGERFVQRSDDALFDLAITANRGDVLSYLGVARELAAKWHQKILIDTPQISEITSDFPDEPQGVSVESAGCIYSLRNIRDVSQTALPGTITDRLQVVGHSLYHPVVDLTNYVMEELGVPLHAFDADKVVEPLEVRFARAGETIELLDNKTSALDKTMLVIADQMGPVALAGIMGGARTAVSQNTQNILLEAAYFDASTIRRTRTKLNLESSAAYRFERGTDPCRALQASDRVATLAKQYLGAAIGPRYDSGSFCDLPDQDQKLIPLKLSDVNIRLGSDFTDEQIQDILPRLGFTYKNAGWSVPSWRHDVTQPEDLIEELARVDGYDNLPRTMLPPADVVSNTDDDRWRKVEQIKDLLALEGWSEHVGSSFLSEREAGLLAVGAGDLIKLANPVSEEAAYLRSTQLLSVLKVIAKNPIFSDLRIFEIGTVWKPSAEKHNGEQTAITLVWTGTKPIKFDFAPNRQFGTSVEQELLNKLKIRRPIMFSEMPVAVITDSLANAEPMMILPATPKFRQPSRFQPVLRDIALLVDVSVDPQKVATAMQSVETVVDVELFDRFIGGKLPEGTQSLAYHLLLEHPDRTLTNEEIEQAMTQVNEIVTQRFTATIR